MNDARNSNEPTTEVSRLMQAAQEALTDSMVERLAASGANVLELLDRLNDEQTREAIHAALDRVTALHKAGALDTMFDLVMLLNAARNAATDTIVERLFVFVEQMLNTVGTEAMGSFAENARLALEEAAEATSQQTPRGGALAALSLLAKPETQRSLGFLLSFADRLQRRTAGP